MLHIRGFMIAIFQVIPQSPNEFRVSTWVSDMVKVSGTKRLGLLLVKVGTCSLTLATP